MKNILYLGSVGGNNLGDELLADLFKEQCNKYLGKKYKLKLSKPNRINVRNYDVIVLGGGSLLQNSTYINVMYKAIKLNKLTVVWGTGFDNKQLNSTLTNSHIPPESFARLLPDKLKEKLIKLVRHSSFIGVRGPGTYQVLKEIGCDMDRVIISGDPGFLLNSDKKMTGFNRKKRKDQIIGVNWGTSYNAIYGQDEEALLNELVKAIRKFIEKGYKIYIYTVWDRDIDPCKHLYHQLNDNKNVVLDTTQYGYRDLMEKLSKFNFTINLKLHASVLSSAVDVPFIALGYRYKIIDFVQSLGLESMVIPTDSNNIPGELIKLEKQIRMDKGLIGLDNDKRKRYQDLLNTPFKNAFQLV
ncbi:polysaccharide pyruvyl transferase family protein [Evansella tamaricis]|uniref:Polysaccharide pyruvyl transferase family protein n=1 Tax=Evansella tamaricis TaxID=2069301 RepID=A0ABS6JI50_9BACI|nr:polysaccharide pyruvyl transferase family protein [Evansella tamaricis]MBU9713322.1 polysaccharide pyruvyl transferase family protein [Evansella tamaricis]